MNDEHQLDDTGERMIPTAEGELSFVFARHRFAYEHARTFVEGKSVLDVGCGTGYGCKILSATAASVVGIDSSMEAIEFCRNNFAAPNVQFVRMDASTLSLERQFDVAISFQVIEHLSDPGRFIDRIKRTVMPGGLILISTPNVRTPTKDSHTNPFHFSEMSCAQFQQLLETKFSSFELAGIGYAAPNRLRALVQSLPFYRLGRYIKRASALKKIAGTAMDMTSFRVIRTDVSPDAIDLLTICTNK